MTQLSVHSLALSALRDFSPDRLQKAVCGLADKSLTVTLTYASPAEIRASVKNGAEISYNVRLAHDGVSCSCGDARFRGTICKHVLATGLVCLQQPEDKDDRVHLMWSSGELFCSATITPYTRFWRRWTLNALNWPDIICQSCVHTWTHPQQVKAAA